MIPKRYQQMHQDFPSLMQSYESFGEAARNAGPLSDREVALVKLAISLGAGLEGAAHSHCRKAFEAGCQPEDLRHVAILSATDRRLSHDDACQVLGRGRDREARSVIRKRLLGVVLVGGRSRRMGRDKALIETQTGATFVEHAHSRLKPICQAVWLSGGQPYELDDAPALTDERPGRGPVGGIVTVLDAAAKQRFAAGLFTPVDTPQLRGEDLQTIARAWRQSPEVPVCAVCRESQRLQPLIAIYPTGIRDDLRKVSESADRSLRRWLQTVEHRTVPLPRTSCHNVNRPEDLSGE